MIEEHKDITEDAACPPSTAPPSAAKLRSFVRRSGRISHAQFRSYQTLASCFVLSPTDGFRDLRADFAREGPVIVEIGFGMGEAAAALAQANPGVNYLGIEVFRAGIGKLLWEIDKRRLDNIRIIEGDAAEILEKNLAEESAAGFHLFFPDPWPKKKHHKRRLVQRPFTNILSSRLVPGAYVYMATDWEDYAHSAMEELTATPGLNNPWAHNYRESPFAPRQAWRPFTRFEQKGTDKARRIYELYFVKNAGV
jgi:tRNA (guanine-N7-)-methyltransferase